MKDILGFDPKKATPEQMAEALDKIEELKTAAEVQKGRADRREMRRREQIRRANYQLAMSPTRKEYNRNRIVDLLLEHFEKEAVMTHSQYQQIMRYNTYDAHNPFDKVYPCPICGELSLSHTPKDDRGRIRIKCYASDCEFECPKWGRTGYDAEDAFTEWLTAQRFIGPNKPKLEEIE